MGPGPSSRGMLTLAGLGGLEPRCLKKSFHLACRWVFPYKPDKVLPQQRFG